tara:strand:- start:5866 stop:6534 length:669 start_codon:yes stop_codon:yes gene_type:complete
MPFIGKASISGNSKFDKYITTVGSGGQTNFPCIIDGGDEYNVYLNGALLKEVLQYTATSSQISLESAASENDKFELHVFRNFFIADAAKRSGDTFTGDVIINDDKKLSFGTTSDVSLEYDEDGTDSLLISGGDVTISDDKKLYFGTGKDAHIEYDEDGTDKLLIQPPAGGIRFADGTLDVDIASHDGSNGLKLGGTLITQTANNINKLATTGKSIAMAIVFG